MPSAQVNPSNTPSVSFTNPYYASQPAASETTSHSQYTANQYTDPSVPVTIGGDSSGMSKRHVTQSNAYPEYSASYNTQQTSYGTSYGGSNNNDNLKSRNVGAAPGYSNTQSYLLSNKNNTISNTNKPTQSNNGAIAILLLPPLALLLICEMSTSLPLLLFLCISLVVYALDLANPGDRSSGSVPRGYYTMCAIWLGWVVLSVIMGYVMVVLDGNYNYVGNIERDDTGEGSGRGLGHCVGVMAVISQLIVSIMLLFCLVSSFLIS
jgi:hypothetical protein